MSEKTSLRWSSRLLVAIVLNLLVCPSPRNAQAETLFVPHPDDASKQVEYFLEKPVGRGPWPTVIFLHGHQQGPRPGGKDFVEWGVLAPARFPVRSNPAQWLGEGEEWVRLSTPLLSLTSRFPLFHTPQDLPEHSTSPEQLEVTHTAVNRAAQLFLEESLRD